MRSHSHEVRSDVYRIPMLIGESESLYNSKMHDLSSFSQRDHFLNRLLGALATLAVVAALGAYSLGYQHGVQVERRAWLATEQTITLPPASVAADGRVLQRPRISTGRTFYSNPHSGRTFIAAYGPPPVNVPDPRDTPVK